MHGGGDANVLIVRMGVMGCVEYSVTHGGGGNVRQRGVGSGWGLPPSPIDALPRHRLNQHTHHASRIVLHTALDSHALPLTDDS